MSETRTAIFWIDGDRYVFKHGEIDYLLGAVSQIETADEAWAKTRELGERFADDNGDDQ